MTESLKDRISWMENIIGWNKIQKEFQKQNKLFASIIDALV